MKKLLIIAFCLTYLSALISCKKDHTRFPFSYVGCHGFAKSEYVFEVTPQTTSVTIGTWKIKNAKDNEADMYLHHIEHESTAVKGIHFQTGEFLENEINEFKTTFTGSSLTSTVTIPIIPENITSPIAIKLRYVHSHYVSTEDMEPAETTITLNPVQP